MKKMEDDAPFVENPRRWHLVRTLVERWGPLLRFGLVGVLQNVVSFALLIAAVELGLAPWQAFALVFPLSVAVTYQLNSRWTFRDRPKSKAAPLSYGLVYGSAYALSLLVSFLLELGGAHDWINTALTIVAIGAYTFVALDRGVFG